MTQPYPLPRELRQSAVDQGDGGASYGPFSFKIFDTADVEAWTLADDDAAVWTKVDGLTVTKTNGLAFDTFSVAFPAGLSVTTKYVVYGRRLHERQVAITRGGSIDSDQLEKELSKQGVALNELRRDVDRAHKALPGDAGAVVGAADIAAAEDNGAIASDAADRADASALAAASSALDWDDYSGAVTYGKNIIVYDPASGSLLRSRVAGNLNNPAVDGAFWKQIFKFLGGVLTKPLTIAVGTVTRAGLIFANAGATAVPHELGAVNFTGGSLTVDLNTGEGLQRHTLLTDRTAKMTAASASGWISYNNAMAGKTAVPLDDTPPQEAEVSDALVNDVHAASTSLAKVHIASVFSVFVGLATPATSIVACIFDGSTCIHAVRVDTPTAGKAYQVALEKVYSPGDFAAHVYSVRIGTAGGTGSVFVNGDNTGRQFGGTQTLPLVIRESF